MIFQSKTNETSYQCGNWLRASIGIANQDRGNWRNEIEVIEAKRIVESELKGKTQGNTKLNVPGKTKEKEKTKLTKEESGSSFQVEKRSLKLFSETCGKLSNKKKRARDCRGDFNAILNDVEKKGGCKKARLQINEFKDLVDELALVDIKPDK
ncbi:hypothetical protein Goshw_027775 [Gossypium schwendimanii]|uniref:Uncharacterized protein n=1 Tax=Gossypium schwendimanii TaxID=34291 RepID=A0A7J9MWF0_GOSSC|nr:hypothetical protein [Gossypium schwendimanii]